MRSIGKIHDSTDHRSRLHVAVMNNLAFLMQIKKINITQFHITVNRVYIYRENQNTDVY